MLTDVLCACLLLQVSLTLSTPQPDAMLRYITELGVVSSTLQLHVPLEHCYGWLSKLHAAVMSRLPWVRQEVWNVLQIMSGSDRSAAKQQILANLPAVVMYPLVLLRLLPLPLLGVVQQLVLQLYHVLHASSSSRNSAAQQPSLARYTAAEVNAIHLMLQPWVLQDMTPRQVKTLLNHHFLLRCIYQQVLMQQHMPTAEQQLLEALQYPGSLQPEVLLPRGVSSPQLQEMKAVLEDLVQKCNQRHAERNTDAFKALISWTFFWGRYPLAMAAMLKVILRLLLC
jgi:hypothetical protein